MLNDRDEEVEPLLIRAECKGIIGNDGRHYILDLLRTFPPDLNFLPARSPARRCPRSAPAPASRVTATSCAVCARAGGRLAEHRWGTGFSAAASGKEGGAGV